MVIKIPNDLLTKFVCDVCHKFLSVKPIKVFPGRKIQCGRCSRQDEGVVSLYELIAEQYCFPCVNRYDGCEELLMLSQVADHEKTCHSRSFVCPICEDDKEIQTFLLIKHYCDKHREALLRIPYFTIDPRESLHVEKSFLYEVKNKLFIINCCLNGSDGTISLNAKHLVVHNRSENITQQFVLHYGSIKTVTEKKLCLSHNETDTTGLITGTSLFELKEPITVDFQINVQRILLSEIPVTKQPEDDALMVATKNSSVPVQHIIHRTGRRVNASLIDSEWSEEDLMKPRKILLNGNLQHSKILSVGSTLDYCIHNEIKKKVYPQCFNCGEPKINYFSSTHPYIRSIETNEGIYLTCALCVKYALKVLHLKLHTYFEIEPWNLGTEIQFFCIWNCSDHIAMKNILEHENACNGQPPRRCPVESCSMKGKLFEIEKHFIEHSPEYSLSLTSSIHVSSDFGINLFRKKIFLVRNAFVFAELTWTNGMWNIKFKLCGEKDTFAGKKLKAMVIDGFKLRTYSESVVMEFKQMSSLTIKFFLEK